jgi:ubiquitin-conjugating enzyme E2 variant
MIPLWFGQAILGWLIADAFSGLFHWWQDRLADERMPIIGPEVVVPNRLHHVDPLAFTNSTILSRNLALWIVAALISAAWLAITGPDLMWLSATAGGLLVNEVHVWAHLPGRNNSLVRMLQETGFLQSPKQHAAHHRAPYARRYCILSDWLNPVLDTLDVWTRLEAILCRAPPAARRERLPGEPGRDRPGAMASQLREAPGRR